MRHRIHSVTLLLLICDTSQHTFGVDLHFFFCFFFDFSSNLDFLLHILCSISGIGGSMYVGILSNARSTHTKMEIERVAYWRKSR